MNTVTFYSHSQLNSETQPWKEKGVDCRVFSNLWSASICIDNEEYASTETYFQQFKYSPGDQLFIRNLTSMSEVASYGQRRLVLRLKHIDLIDSLRTKGLPVPLNPQGNPYKLKDKASPVLLIEDWDTVKIPVMYAALRAKFTQHESLKENLLNTEEHWLIEHTKNDRQWGDGLNGEGTNYLGKLLMQLRTEIRTQESGSTSVSLKDVQDNVSFDYNHLQTKMKHLHPEFYGTE